MSPRADRARLRTESREPLRADRFFKSLDAAVELLRQVIEEEPARKEVAAAALVALRRAEARASRTWWSF